MQALTHGIPHHFSKVIFFFSKLKQTNNHGWKLEWVCPVKIRVNYENKGGFHKYTFHHSSAQTNRGIFLVK